MSATTATTTFFFDCDDTLSRMSVDDAGTLESPPFAKEVLGAASKLGSVRLLSRNLFAFSVLREVRLAKYFPLEDLSSRDDSFFDPKWLRAESMGLELSQCVLFDDDEESVLEFKKHGGRAYLVEDFDLVGAWKRYRADG